MQNRGRKQYINEDFASTVCSYKTFCNMETCMCKYNSITLLSKSSETCLKTCLTASVQNTGWIWSICEWKAFPRLSLNAVVRSIGRTCQIFMFFKTKKSKSQPMCALKNFNLCWHWRMAPPHRWDCGQTQALCDPVAAASYSPWKAHYPECLHSSTHTESLQLESKRYGREEEKKQTESLQMKSTVQLIYT